MSRYSIILIILLALPASLYCQNAEGLYGQIRNSKLATSDDTLSYALAIMSYTSWSRDNVYPDPVIFARALIESKSGTPLMSEEKARNFIMAYIKDRQAKQAEIDKAKYKDYIDANEAFLANNRLKPSVKVTPSGLQYEVVTMGTGPVPSRESTVKVHYTGRLIDGTEFDSSVRRNAPAQFQVSGVIPGWTEALQLMPVGSRFILYIPQALGYGSRGAGDRIKPYSTLIFEVELLEIVK